MIAYIFVHILCAIISLLIVYNKFNTLSLGDIFLIVPLAPITMVVIIFMELVEYLSSIKIIGRR